MNVLIIAEHNNVLLSHSTRHAVTAGLELGSVTLLIAGDNCQSVVDEGKKIKGVSNVLVAEAPHYKYQLPEELAPLVSSLKNQYDYFIAAASVFGKNLQPRIAALLDVSQISDVTKIIDPRTFEHPIYAGNIIETIQTSAPKIVLTIRTTAFAVAPSIEEEAIIIEQEILSPSNLVEYVSANLTQSDRPSLDQAKVIVSGGRALQSRDNFEALLVPLADKLHAAIGASRAAVDSGFTANDFQVGQTGKVVAPELYIALGISGAIQHVAGMQESKVIVAINNDPDAQIFNIADYGLVGDIFEIIPELTQKL